MNGLCIQWGCENGPDNISGKGEYTYKVTMPLAFSSSENYQVTYSISCSSSSAGNECQENRTDRTSQKFQVYLYNRNDSTWINNPKLIWLAIGY